MTGSPHVPSRPGLQRFLIARTSLVLSVVVAGVVGACSSPHKTAERVEKPVVTRDMPQVLRGTVGAETTLRGIEPVLVSGFGIVVGLNGTGGNANLDPAVQATMERELARGGIGKAPARDLAVPGVSPAEFLRDKNVAVVIVEAAIPPGAPKGAEFDVRVRALPNSEVTSIEGGMLWSTDLRVGPATVFQGYKTHQIGVARGPIFVNPFAEPGKPGDTVTRTVGRVIGGGAITNPLRIEMVLDNESHARARSILNALNTRFPQGRNDDGPIATGRDGSSLAIRIPYEYRDKCDEFIKLMRHTRIDQSQPQEWACRYVEELKRTPELAEDLTWCLRALGDQAIRSGCVHPMYEWPELGPRLAALEVGARLGDPRVVPYLKELVSTGTPGIRAAAIDLMGDMISNPSVGLALRELVNAPELEVRIAAYEALEKRGDPLIDRRAVGMGPSGPKFSVDLVPARDQLIYVTQQGQPRIVLFGGKPSMSGMRESIKLNKPLLVSAWSDRFMLSADSESAPVRVFYRDARFPGGSETGHPAQFLVPDRLPEFIEVLSQRSTADDPTPGLNMTFSEIVGALCEIQKQKGVNAAFATETDRLGASVYAAARSTVVEDRPISSSGEKPQQLVTYEPTKPAVPTPAVADGDGKPKSLVQPLEPIKKKD